MRGLSNIFIDDVLQNCTRYHGCYAADMIPIDILEKKQHFSIIVNLSVQKDPGTHFITIIGFPNYIYYIDSVGWPCMTPPITHFLSSLNRPIFYNYKQIQSYQSAFCSLYCILFVFFLVNLKNIETNTLLFSQPMILMEMIKNLYNIYVK